MQRAGIHPTAPALASAWRGQLQGGYSLLELVMVIVMIGLIGTTIASLLSGGVGAFNSGREAVDTLSKLRLTSERLARELRTVRRDPVTPTNFDFLSRTPTSVQFQRLENDGTTVTTVTVDTSGTNLRLAYSTPAGAHTLTDQLSVITFSYLQQDGITVSVSNTDIAFVDLSLSLIDANGNSYPQRTRIALRNRQ